MTINYKYTYQQGLWTPPYEAGAMGTDTSDDASGDFAICVFPNSEEYIHVVIPVIPMIDDLIDGYDDKAIPILIMLINGIKSRLADINSTTSWFMQIPMLSQRQDALRDQLDDLYSVALRLGMQNAAQWLRDNGIHRQVTSN